MNEKMSRQKRKRILNALMNRQYKKIRRYSTTDTCSEPIQGFEAEYSRHRERIKRIQSAKCKILFAEFKPCFMYLAEILKARESYKK